MKRSILYIIMIITVILGIIVIKTKDFNYSVLYSKHKRLEVVLEQQYNLDDVKKIVKETIKTETVTKTSTAFETSISIEAKDFKDEEISNLFNKLNEKYSQNYQMKDLRKIEILEELKVETISNYSDEELTKLSNEIKEKYGIEYTNEELQKASSLVRVSNVEKTNAINMLKDYIMPVLISLAIIMAYVAIRFCKLYKHAWIIAPIKLAFELLLNQGFILSVIAITRIPMSEYIPCILILIWMLQILSETIKYEIELKKTEE